MIYDPAECIVLTNGRSPFGELLNMTRGFPLKWDNRVWKSSEALYQACRFPDNEKLQDEIRKASNGYEAKRVAKAHEAETRADWYDGNVRLAAMACVIQIKAEQHPKIRQQLQRTQGMQIVEFSKRDNFWGAKPVPNIGLVGENWLGRILMSERDHERRLLCHNLLPGASISEFFA